MRSDQVKKAKNTDFISTVDRQRWRIMKKWILAYVPFILIVIIFSSFLVYEYLGSADLNDGQSDTTYYRSGYPPHQHPNGI